MTRSTGTGNHPRKRTRINNSSGGRGGVVYYEKEEDEDEDIMDKKAEDTDYLS